MRHETALTSAAAAMLAIAAVSIAGETCVDHADAPFVLGGVDTPGEAQAVAIDGTLAVVADGTGGLRVLDVTDLENPLETGALAATPVVDVALAGATAIAVTGASLEAVDVSDPSTPTVLASLPIADGATRVVIAGTHAYTIGSTGLHVVDVSTPSVPSVVGSVVVGAPNDVDVDGTHAYVVTATGITVVDVTTPAVPAVVGSYVDPAGDDWRRIAVRGDHAYALVASGFSDALRIVDIRDPANPDPGSGPSLADGTRDVTSTETHVYVTAGSPRPGVHVLVRGGSPHLTRLSFVDTRDEARGIAITTDRLVVACDVTGACTVDPSRPGHAAYLDLVTHDVDIHEDLAAVASGNSTVTLLDVSDPIAPGVLSTIAVAGTLFQLAHDGATLYGVGTGGLDVIDTSDPTAPVHVTTIDPGEPLHDVALVGSHLLVHDGADLRVYDRSIPTAPVLAHSVGLPGTVEQLRIVGDHAYVCHSNGLTLVDVADPAAAAILSELSIDFGALASAVHGSIAYVTDFGFDALHAVDVSDPTNPTILFTQEFAVQYGLAMEVRWPYLYVGGFDPGFWVYDITDPVAPALLATQRTYALTEDFEIHGDYLYLGNGTDLRVMPLQCDPLVGVDPSVVVPATPLALELPRPMPAAGPMSVDLVVSAPAWVRATVHDVSGRRIDAVFEGRLDAGRHTLRWDTRRHASGTYYLTACSEATAVTRRVVVVR